MSATSNRDKIVSVRMTHEQWERIRAVSQAEGDYSPSGYVRRIVASHTATLFVAPPPAKEEPRPRKRSKSPAGRPRRRTPQKRSRGKSKR